MSGNEPQASTKEVVLKERVFGQSGSKPIEYKVSLQVTDETFVIRLDAKKNDSSLHATTDMQTSTTSRCRTWKIAMLR